MNTQAKHLKAGMVIRTKAPIQGAKKFRVGEVDVHEGEVLFWVHTAKRTHRLSADPAKTYEVVA